MTKSEVHIRDAWLLMGILTLITTITAFGRNKLAAVYLGPTGIGIYAQGLTFLTFAATFCTLGMGQGIVKHLAEDEDPRMSRSRIILTSLFVQLTVALAVTVLVVVSSTFVSESFLGGLGARKYAVLIGATIPFTVLLANLGYFLQGLKRLSDFVLASSINALLGLLLFVGLIIPLGLDGAILSLLVVTSVGVVILGLIFLRKPLQSTVERPAFTQTQQSQLTISLLKYGGAAFLSGVLETLSALLLRTWIINYRSVAANGIYQAVVGLSGQYIGLFVLFNNAYLYPKLSSLRSPVENTAEINAALRTGMMLAIPLIVTVIIFRRELILLLFTSEFLLASDVLVFQSVGDALKIIVWFIAASLLPQGRLREYLGLSAFFAIVYLTLSFTFLRIWDLVGLAIAYCLSYFVYGLVLLAVQAKLIRFRLEASSLSIIVASSVLTFAILWLPNESGSHYTIKVGLLAIWFFLMGGPRLFASVVYGVTGRIRLGNDTNGLDRSTKVVVDDGMGSRFGRSAGITVETVSVIVPVRNEADSIKRLITHLQQQTFKPSEIVITDGGSVDNTRDLVRGCQQSATIPIILLEDEDAFPGRGRNLGIRKAANEWIACVDAGIVPELNWLEELVKTSRRHPDKLLIQGKYQPIVDTYFTECAAIAYIPPKGPSQSVASCLFHRSIWKAVQGFPEDLRSGEDLIFFRRLRAIGIDSAMSDRALVHWQLQRDTSSTFRRFATYSRYGMKAGLAHEWQLRVSLIYFVFALLLLAAPLLWLPLALTPIFLLAIRSQRRIYRWYEKEGINRQILEVSNPKRVLWVTWINFVIDLAMFRGMVDWLWFDVLGKNTRDTSNTQTSK